MWGLDDIGRDLVSKAIHVCLIIVCDFFLFPFCDFICVVLGLASYAFVDKNELEKYFLLIFKLLKALGSKVEILFGYIY